MQGPAGEAAACDSLTDCLDHRSTGPAKLSSDVLPTGRSETRWCLSRERTNPLGLPNPSGDAPAGWRDSQTRRISILPRTEAAARPP